MIRLQGQTAIIDFLSYQNIAIVPKKKTTDLFCFSPLCRAAVNAINKPLEAMHP